MITTLMPAAVKKNFIAELCQLIMVNLYCCVSFMIDLNPQNGGKGSGHVNKLIFVLFDSPYPLSQSPLNRYL